MSQSFANTNSFPIELGLGSSQTDRWVWPKFTFHFDPFKGYSRFLRYPGPKQGLGYRMMRAGVIIVLRVRGLSGTQ